MKSYDNVIGEKNIGIFQLCKAVNSKDYNQFKFRIDTNTYEENSWLSYSYYSDSDNEWICLETTDIDSLKTIKITTNSKDYVTHNGTRVGDTFEDFLNKNNRFNFIIENDEINLILDTSIYLRLEHKDGLDEVFNMTFFDKNKMIKKIPKKTKIEEISIIYNGKNCF